MPTRQEMYKKDINNIKIKTPKSDHSIYDNVC